MEERQNDQYYDYIVIIEKGDYNILFFSKDVLNDKSVIKPYYGSMAVRWKKPGFFQRAFGTEFCLAEIQPNVHIIKITSNKNNIDTIKQYLLLCLKTSKKEYNNFYTNNIFEYMIDLLDKTTAKYFIIQKNEINQILNIENERNPLMIFQCFTNLKK